jgi:outer membrane protein TolC
MLVFKPRRAAGAPVMKPRGLIVAAAVACAMLVPVASVSAADQLAAPSTPLVNLVAEALRNNPELSAARKEQEAAAQRVAPAAALDDPMLEAGVLNLPTSSWSFSREDMTMKMLGLSQRLPYPGKRDLRRDVAQKEAESLALGYRETANRVVRELKVAYYDLALALESSRAVGENRALIEQLLKLAENRYRVGQGSQLDVLKTQTQLSTMNEELIRLEQEKSSREADIDRVLGRKSSAPLAAQSALDESPLTAEKLREQALANRPQLQALQTLVGRGDRALELARKDSLPDFDVRFAYGQRDAMPVGSRRSDMVSLTVAMNLPVWHADKTAPRISEAQAMRDQAASLYEAQRNETATRLDQQIAAAQRSLRTARLYRTELLPQARLAADAALAAYQVSRGEFGLVLESRMMTLNYEIAYATAVTDNSKARAEIEFLTGSAQGAEVQP